MTFITRLIAAFGVAMLAGVAFGGSANAQASRTWVSGVGDDVNPCSRTAPCKTFAGAISKTASGGEINVIDAGGFGAVTVTKPISIIAEGFTAGILSAGTNGVIISSSFTPAGGRVFLKGLDIEGFGTGLSGVNILGAARVVIEDTNIRNLQTGVNIDAPAGTRVALNRVTILHNSQAGVAAVGANKNQIFIQDSLIDTSTVAFNVGGSAQAVIANSTFSGSTGGQDLTIAAGGVVVSYGDNVIRTGSPTSTTSRK